MSSEKPTDIRKEFKDFEKSLENSTPLIDGDLEFDDFDNLLKDSNEYSNIVSDNLNDFLDSDDLDYNGFSNDLNAIDSSDKFPHIDLETDDIQMSLIIKKDYSKIKDSKKRKMEFINDLKEFIDEFASTDESDDLMDYYE